MQFFNANRTHLNYLLMALVLSLAPLQMAAAQNDVDEDGDNAPLFYPALPEAPRIQYLASFSVSGDVKEKEEKSGWLASFVLGEEDPEDMKGPEKPYGVALNNGEIHVVDTRGGGYAIFDIPNKDYRFVYGSGASAMDKPINMTIAEDGMKYVTDTVKEKVFAFDGNDRFIRAYGLKEDFKPTDVRSLDDRLYVSDLAGHRVVIFNKADGTVLGNIGTEGEQDELLFQPTNIAIGPDRHLYVSDTNNYRVQKYTLDGKFIRSYGRGIGNMLGNFARPKGIDLDKEGRLYVVDAAFENVQIFNNEGELLLFFGEKSADHEGGFDLPTDVVIDYDSAAYFQSYADPAFKLEYVILVANQFGRSKVSVFGFGRYEGMDYTESQAPQ
jgi:hypothetical protein